MQKVGGGDPALHFITLHYSVIITLHFIALHHSVIITPHFITFVHCNTMPLYWSTSHYIGEKRWEEAIPHYGNMRPTRQEHGRRGGRLLQEYEECDKYDENDMMEVFDVDGRTETHTGYIENIFCSM